MTRSVVAGGDRGVFHLGGADKADLSVIRIVGSSSDLLGAYRRSCGGLRIFASPVSILLVASTEILSSASSRFASVCAFPGVLLGVRTAGGGSPSTASAATTTTLA